MIREIGTGTAIAGAVSTLSSTLKMLTCLYAVLTDHSWLHTLLGMHAARLTVVASHVLIHTILAASILVVSMRSVDRAKRSTSWVVIERFAV